MSPSQDKPSDRPAGKSGSRSPVGAAKPGSKERKDVMTTCQIGPVWQARTVTVDGG